MDRPDLPRPLHRLGPRPLMLHLMLAMKPSRSWPDVWRSWSASSPNGNPARTEFSGILDPAFVAGIAAYRRHPWQRDLVDPPVIWSEGGSHLLDYGPSGAPPVLVVPSLVNRAHVLDLMDGHSMLRFLATGGVRPLLLDWGWPGSIERQFTLTDYIAGRLERAIRAVGGPVTLLGYCMGGLLAVAAALRRPDLVARLALLATPWDFWAADAAGSHRVAACLPWLEPAFALSGAMPVDVLQALFSLADPANVSAKYRSFAAQDQASARARRFVALEDWLNDGVPLAAPVAREVLGGWYGSNTPALGHWRVAGEAVRPEALKAETFVAIPARDRIVPPESALALAALLPGADICRPRAGHVGMVAGAGAQAALWKPLLAWLTQSSAALHSAHPGPSSHTRGDQTGNGVDVSHLGRAPANAEGIAGMADVDTLAHQYGVSEEAVSVLRQAVQRGGGRMAQFSHPELGGMGQWSAGGMTQIGAMFDTALRDKVTALCAALAQQAPVEQPSSAPTPDENWWPRDLGHPSSAGAQNGMRYACFPDRRRVAIEQAGHVTVYDSGEHRIGGVSQSQGTTQKLQFTSQLGTVRAQDLPVAP